MNAREDKLARRYEKAAAELKYNPINPRKFFPNTPM